MLGPKLGQGAFGEVFAGRDSINRHPVAIKLARLEKSNNLKKEVKIYHLLDSPDNPKIGIPRLRCHGTDGDYYFLIMDQLGPSLNDILEKSGKSIPMAALMPIAMQALTLLEYIHSKNLIHQDLKPNNMLLGKGANRYRLYLIDFGLTRSYIDDQGEHIPYRCDKSLTGTARYVSINTHLGIQPARRDDLESLGYVLIYLAKKKLPWQGIKAPDKYERQRMIGEKKRSIKLGHLCRDLPVEFVRYLDYCQNLGFTDQPDYGYLKSLFINVMKRYDYDNSHFFKWVDGIKW